MYHLQSRWKLNGRKLIYYGLRNSENMFNNEISITKAQTKVIESLPKSLNEHELKIIDNLLNIYVVKQDKLRKIPKSLNEATFCKNCCANDFMIPGLEFDNNGLCPMCQTQHITKDLRSIVPILKDIPKSNKSRFDVALFYTGGKDSTFLLHYLSKEMGLRVLAMTWEIPFMSESAKQSIENAKKHFTNVEFITRSVNSKDIQTIYKKLYQLNENTCACPSLAYVLFYPEMVSNRVPYFMAGNEPAQMLGLYYNHMAPKFAYHFHKKRFWQFLINFGRILTLRPVLKQGQFHTLMTMKQLAYGDHFLKKISGYQNELVGNVVTAIHELPQLVLPLKRSIRYSSLSGRIPAFVHIDFDEICNGNYDWLAVKDKIVKECGWVSPKDSDRNLHTSCKIEKCKEFSQFVRFYHCRSRMIPFSAIEIALASRNKNLSREDAIKNIEQSMGFSLNEVPECKIMCAFLEEKT